MPRSLATAMSAAATARTCVTPPGDAVDARRSTMVCTESTTSSRGAPASTWPSTAAEVGLGGEVQPVVHRAGALGPQPHLPGRLLTGDVAARPCRLGAPRCGRRRAAASTCPPRARRRAARRRPAPGRRRAPGRARSTPVGRRPASLDVDLADRPRRRRGAAATTRRHGRGARPRCVPHAWHSGQRPTHFAARARTRHIGRSAALSSPPVER